MNQVFCITLVLFAWGELSASSDALRPGIDIGNNQRFSGVVHAYPGEHISIGGNDKQPYDRPVDPAAGYRPQSGRPVQSQPGNTQYPTNTNYQGGNAGIEIGNNQRFSGVVHARPGEHISIGVNDRQSYDRPVDPAAGYRPQAGRPTAGVSSGPNGITIGNRNTIQGGIHQELEPGSHFGGAVVVPNRPDQQYNSNTRNRGSASGGLIINGEDVSRGSTRGNVCIGRGNIVNGREIPANC